MKKANTYLFLAAIFLAAYLIIEFTAIYGDSGWVKAFLLIAFVTYLLSGISRKRKELKK